MDGIPSYGISMLWQEAKKFTDPYIDQVAMVTRPHLDKVSVVLQPCAEKVIYAYGQFIRTATFYHHEVWLCTYDFMYNINT